MTPAFGATVDSVDASSHSATQAKIIIIGDGFEQDNVNIFEIPGAEPRVVIDIADAKTSLIINGAYEGPQFDSVRGIRGAERNADDIRLVLDLKADSVLSGHNITAQKIEINLSGQFFVQESPVENVSALESLDQINVPTPRLKPTIARRPVIVIDAGHGGHDPGALGASGLKEKKVTLLAAQELKRQLEDTNRYKVVLSRQNDSYVDHDDRLRIARANGADLFISIHADATAGSSARGASVYTLADRAKNRSRNIVNSQNWIMDVNLEEQTDNVGNILVDLAQRNTFSQSTEFADLLIAQLGGSTHLLRNTHRRAGYYVLLAPDVPAVLLEMGFISNPEDERLLKTSAHRQKVMRSVTAAINRYFDIQKS
ncbi:MAG: N-acetylmuramoyl-L-alanine amidase [Hellea sp.]|nr:N-acetylmuramoyl-L-alanine amidase [Hellea sp.]